jgi:hypothetical protein
MTKLSRPEITFDWHPALKAFWQIPRQLLASTRKEYQSLYLMRME